MQLTVLSIFFVFISLVEIEALYEYKHVNNSCTRVTPVQGISALKDLVGSGVNLDVYYWSGLWAKYQLPFSCATYNVVPNTDGTFNATFSFRFWNIPISFPTYVVKENPTRKGEYEAFAVGTVDPEGLVVVAAAEGANVFGWINCFATDGDSTKQGLVIGKRGFDGTQAAESVQNKLAGVAVGPWQKLALCKQR